MCTRLTRVVLKCRLSIGSLDFVWGSVTLEAEDLVRINGGGRIVHGIPRV